MKKGSPLLVYSLRLYFNSIGLLFPDYSANFLINLFSSPLTRVIRSKEKDVLKQSRQEQLLVAGVSLQVYTWGEGEKMAMLFHGWQSNAGSLGAFVEPLLAEGYKVIAFDAPAHGNSQGKKANLVYFKRAAKALFQKYGTPELAVGHSLGANSIIMTAFEDALEIPKVVLISPLNRLMSVFEEMQEQFSIPDRLFDLFIDKFGRNSGYEFRDFYFHKFGERGPLESVILLHDKNDRITSFSHAEEMKEGWPSLYLKGIEGSGHYKILWSEETLQSAMNFIKNN
jgi:pimeloyl-ACP methyl ester carboxylesterase